MSSISEEWMTMTERQIALSNELTKILTKWSCLHTGKVVRHAVMGYALICTEEAKVKLRDGVDECLAPTGD